MRLPLIVINARVFAAVDGLHVIHNGRQSVVRLRDYGLGDQAHVEGDGRISAPMHGRLLALFVAEGDKIAKGQRLAVVEAMKMEHTLIAPFAGTVSEVAAMEGSQVAEGARLLLITPQEEDA